MLVRFLLSRIVHSMMKTVPPSSALIHHGASPTAPDAAPLHSASSSSASAEEGLETDEATNKTQPPQQRRGSNGNPLSFLASITMGVFTGSAKDNAAPSATTTATTEAVTGSIEQEQTPKDSLVAESKKSRGKVTAAVATASKAKKAKKHKKAKSPPATDKHDSKKRKRKEEKKDKTMERNVVPRRTHEKSSASKNKIFKEGEALAVSSATLDEAVNNHNVPPSHVFVMGNNNNNKNSMSQQEAHLRAAEIDEYLLARRMRDARTAALESTAVLAGQHQLQQLQQRRLLFNEMLMMEDPAMSRLSENYLTHQFAALEQEELELAALRRRREALLMNLNTREELLMHNREDLLRSNPFLMGGNSGAAAAALGLSSRLEQLSSAAAAGPSLFAQRLSGLASAPLSGLASAPGSMATPPSSLSALMASMGAGMGNAPSPSLLGLTGQNHFSLAAAALPSSITSSMGTARADHVLSSINPGLSTAAAASATAGKSPVMTAKPPAPATIASTDASKAASGTAASPKHFAPARGVFNKNIKTKDEMIDSLVRANARLYKGDDQKSGQRFRNYQCEQWTQKYHELLKFKEENGNW
jgi:hypothetical protein